MEAVILAGGRGTRMGAMCADTPKPLLPLAGEPVIMRQIRALSAEGIRKITVVAGYLADRLISALGDGAAFGVSLRHYREETPLGTAGALGSLGLTEDFLLLSGDLLFSFSLPDMAAFHRERGALATLFAHPNAHPFDSAVLETDGADRITAFLPKNGKPAEYPNLCNAGIQIVSPALFAALPAGSPADLDRDVLRPAVSTGRLYAYRSAEYVRDLGTPARFAAAGADLAAGLPRRLRRDVPKPAVFLDRDGTLNVYRGDIAAPEQIELLPGAAEAVRSLNLAGVPAILVTNQPVVARGLCSMETLARIHMRLETLLGEEGAYLDAIYVCPHHPERGFPGEVPALKIPCRCRKPSPGMLLMASKRFGISLSDSWMVGDTRRDMETAGNAGCRGAFLLCGKQETPPPGVPVYPDLSAFTQAYLSSLRRDADA